VVVSDTTCGPAGGVVGLPSDCVIKAAMTVAAAVISAAMTTAPRASVMYDPPLDWQGVQGCSDVSLAISKNT
jgi:hypothetical protein